MGLYICDPDKIELLKMDLEAPEKPEEEEPEKEQ